MAKSLEDLLPKLYLHSCKNGNADCVATTLRAGVDLNTKDSEGFTGLMLALLQNRNKVIGLLLEKEEIDINSTECNNSDGLKLTPLLVAVDASSVACIRLLLTDESLDPNIPGDSDTGAESPLLLAVDNSAVQIVQLLLDSPRTDSNVGVQNTQIDMAPLTPLMHAMKMNKEAMVKILLADPRVNLYTTENFDRKFEDKGKVIWLT